MTPLRLLALGCLAALPAFSADRPTVAAEASSSPSAQTAPAAAAAGDAAAAVTPALPPAPSLLRPLKLGMTTATVRTEWGKPQRIKKIHSPYRDTALVEWTYARVTASRARPLPVRMVNQPTFDALNSPGGGIMNVPVESYTATFVDQVDGVTLTFRNDRLVRSQPFRTEQQRFSN